MAYQLSTVSAMSDIPAIVGTFAQTVGFTVDLTTPSAPIVKHPTDASALSFKLTFESAHPTSSITALTYYDRLVWTCTTAGPLPAAAYAPRLHSGAAAPTTSVPTQIHLFGALMPAPYIAIVIEFGYNQYRHLYLGHMVKASGYTGGEVISGQSIGTGNSTSSDLNSDPARFYASTCDLFSGSQSLNSTHCGGVRIVHANNATAWRSFYKNSTWSAAFETTVASQIASLVIGGYQDPVNYGYAAAGRAPYSAQMTLTPVNLYIGQLVSGFSRFQFVGYPPGIRMALLDGVDPGAEINVGSDVWKVFPALRKTSSGAMPTGAVSPYWPQAETSAYRGYAYLKG